MSSVTKSPARATSATRRRRPGAGREAFWAVVFIVPVLLALVVLRIIPTITAVASSLQTAPPGGLLPATFNGLGNYIQLFGDPAFLHTVGLTVFFNVIINPLQILLALLIAVLLTRNVAAKGVWRTMIFIPVTVPIVGSSIVWAAALAPNGPVNALIEALGGQPQKFLGSPDQALWCIMVIASWIGIGYWMLFLISGIEALPEDVFEAARLDRSGPVRTFFQITIPLLRRPLLFVLVADTVANFVLFAPIQILTQGGPQSSTNLLMFDAYQTTYTYGSTNQGSAEIVILAAIMLVFVLLQFVLLREERS